MIKPKRLLLLVSSPIFIIGNLSFNNHDTDILAITFNTIKVESFVSADPLRINNNVFEFVNNDPINTLDRNGKCPVCGAGEICMGQFMNEHKSIVGDYYEMANDFGDYYGLAHADAFHIMRMSWLDHNMSSDATIAEEIRFAKKIKVFSRELNVVREKYVQNFPAELRNMITSLSTTNDLIMLQPGKYSQMANINHTYQNQWRRIFRMTNGHIVPTLDELSQDVIAQSSTYFQYSKEINAVTSRFAPTLEGSGREYAENIAELFNLNSAKEGMEAFSTLQRDIYKIPLEIRQHINPENSLLMGSYNPGDRRLAFQYMNSTFGNGVMTMQRRSLAYFPEMFAHYFPQKGYENWRMLNFIERN